jgi:hypothetical protein
MIPNFLSVNSQVKRRQFAKLKNTDRCEYHEFIWKYLSLGESKLSNWKCQVDSLICFIQHSIQHPTQCMSKNKYSIHVCYPANLESGERRQYLPNIDSDSHFICGISFNPAVTVQA